MDDALDRDARVMNWESGVSLDLAWIRFGDERQRNQQVTRMGTPSSLVIQSLMMVDVFSRIADGELVAWGYRTHPTPLDGPVAIPADVFTVRPKPGMTEDTVEASGFRYERVTVVRAADAAAGPSPMRTSVQASLPANNPGPRSGKAVIIAAYRHHLEAGKIPATHTRVEAWSILYPYLKEHHADDFPAGRGLSYKSFARHLTSIRRG